ncbi:DUF2971 domain-containing protein [Brachyspira sp.]|uniref:DUF2971 domain-containing protein n=1 Tax=Brachyspira sp. TaxID=1977261 RepID=UPI00260C3716|nr:DUF2971 domain-containing protein [Brachyspira sp.]
MEKNNLPQNNLYRITRLEHLIDDLDNEVITFSHPTVFEDVKEYKELDSYFVQCWSKTYESPMMWGEYSKDHLGIMIKFNSEKYREPIMPGVSNDGIFKPFPFDSYWRDMEYDYEEFEKHENNNKLEYLFHKRKGYEYENECRWVLDLNKNNYLLIKNKNNKEVIYPKIVSTFNNGKYYRFVKLPFKKDIWNLLISEIIIDPNANNDYFEYVYDQLSIRIKAEIKRSTFNGKTEKLNINNMSGLKKLYYLSNDININDIEKDLNPISNSEDIKPYILLKHRKALQNTLVFEILDIKIIDKILTSKDIILNFYLSSYLILTTLKRIFFPGEFTDEESRNNAINLYTEYFLIIINFSHDLILQDVYNGNDNKQFNENKKFLNENKNIIKKICIFLLSNKKIAMDYFYYWKNLYIESLQTHLYNLECDLSALRSYRVKQSDIHYLATNLYGFIHNIIMEYISTNKLDNQKEPQQ